MRAHFLAAGQGGTVDSVVHEIERETDARHFLELRIRQVQLRDGSWVHAPLGEILAALDVLRDKVASLARLPE